METKWYTGIGSRKTPEHVLEELEKIAATLASRGYSLRSGGAKGADSAFERGASNKRVYRSCDLIPDWCFVEVKKHIPPNRPPFENMKRSVQRLLARNMMQVLGSDGCTPSEFLVYWTPAGLQDGGTGYALRCAVAHGVKTYNLKNDNERDEFYSSLMLK